MDNDYKYSGRILAVDDTPSHLRQLISILRQHRYIVHPAKSGRAALRFLETELPDLILLDTIMPEIDGYHLCERLKAEARTQRIPVIFISGASQPLDKMRAFSCGCVDYIIKPFYAEEVLARVKTHMTLSNLQKDLEERVAVRTAELYEANARLNAQIAERMRVEGRVRLLVESNIIGVMYWSVNGRIIEANDAFLRIIGYSREELTSGKICWTSLTPPEYLTADERAMSEIRLTGSCAPYEKEYIHKDGSRVPVLLGYAVFSDSPNQGVAFVVDLSKRKRAEERIYYLAHHDVLTGLPNREVLEDRINAAIAQARRNQGKVAVLFVDLDHFKNVNDSLGHAIGDQLLIAASDRLKQCLREGDSVTRLGGDEFVILLPSLERRDDAISVAQKVLKAMSLQFLILPHELRITASVGISLYPMDATDVDGLMRAADAAMYHAKEMGRGNYQVFTQSLNEMAHQRLILANQLHRAFERGELTLHYQPQIDLEENRIFAVEALLRWRPSDDNAIPTCQFIEVAEETGLIVPIGEWVLRQACEQLSRWRRAGHLNLRVAVNLSARQFSQPRFNEVVAQSLARVGLPASALELEITESVLMRPSEENLFIMRELALMGVKLSVDDFGTGYSSLAYLQRFPIHALKKDKSFVTGIKLEPNDAAIVAAILALAQSLRLKVVAEGVENSEQATFLKAHGCYAAQGFYYSEPVAAEKLGELLNKPMGVV